MISQVLSIIFTAAVRLWGGVVLFWAVPPTIVAVSDADGWMAVADAAIVVVLILAGVAAIMVDVNFRGSDTEPSPE